MYPFIRPLLFKLDPERAHALTLALVRLAGDLPPARALLRLAFAAPPKPVQAFGLRFENPVGLAAGYDKDARALRGLAALGFGHLEVGTVTPLAQAGNPRPRIFRLVPEQGIINRMGFPGRGAEQMAGSLLRQRNPGTVIGVNLGKNRDTPLEQAAEDYLRLMRRFTPLADYLVINISSPNTAGLRRLQGRAMLEELLGALRRQRMEDGAPIPILVKIAPDLEEGELEDALGVILDQGMDGVIATNTTLGRAGVNPASASEQGGLSGRPLAERSEQVLGRVVAFLAGRLPVVSVGGIMTPEDAKRRLGMGAALVQVYTGLVYAGPGLVRRILQAI